MVIHRFNPFFGFPLGLFVIAVIFFDKKYAMILILISIALSIGMVINERNFHQTLDDRLQLFAQHAEELHENSQNGELIMRFLNADSDELEHVDTTKTKLYVKEHDILDEDSMYCGICCDDVVESNIKIYYSTCGNTHSMCGNCIKKLLFQENDCVKYKCPYCRRYNIILCN